MLPTTYRKHELSVEDTELLQQMAAYVQASHSPNTIRSYESMCKKFQAWCVERGYSFLPTSAEVIAVYITSLGKTVSFSTLDSTLAAIEASHKKAGAVITGDHSLYRCVRKGVRRTHKENQTLKQAPVITVPKLMVVCSKLEDSLKDCRDRALLTLTFFGAFRRSEVVSLDLKDVVFTDKGAVVTLLQSKGTDTKQDIHIANARDKEICPVRALKAWIEKAQITEGAIFLSLLRGGKVSGRLSGHGVSEIIKQHFGEEYSGHSARRGLVTASAEKGTPMHIIKKHSRHKSADMVMRYINDATGFENSAVAVLGV